MFYLTTHSTHFAYDYMELDTDHLDKKRRNLLPSFHGLLFSINSKESVICTIPQTG